MNMGLSEHFDDFDQIDLRFMSKPYSFKEPMNAAFWIPFKIFSLPKDSLTTLKL